MSWYNVFFGVWLVPQVSLQDVPHVSIQDSSPGLWWPGFSTRCRSCVWRHMFRKKAKPASVVNLQNGVLCWYLHRERKGSRYKFAFDFKMWLHCQPLHPLIKIIVIPPAKIRLKPPKCLKTLDTIGNCQRPVFSLCVYQHVHKGTILWKFERDWSSELRGNYERKNPPLSHKMCAWFLDL